MSEYSIVFECVPVDFWRWRVKYSNAGLYSLTEGFKDLLAHQYKMDITGLGINAE